MDGLTSRQLNLLIAFPVFIAIAVIVGVLILRRDPKYRGNQFFAISIWFTGLALLFNLLYLFLENHQLIIILNICSIASINLGLVIMLIAVFILYKGESVVMKNKLTYVFLIGSLILIILHGFLPGGVDVLVITDPPSLEPHWAINFGIYELILSQTLFLALIYSSIKLYQELSPEIKRKFKRFVVGVFFINITLLNIIILNMRIIPGYESISGIFNLGAVIGLFLVYFGLVRR